MRCGLLGRKLGHSYSPKIHALLGDYDYILYEKEPEDLERFLRSGEFQGLNVTIPYKKAVVPFLDELSPVAERLGNVNTIVRGRDGRLVGHNTDFEGFRSLISLTKVDFSGKKVLVLGSGGAAKTATSVLEQLGARVVIISRTGPDNYCNLDRHADAALIVNATPVGMYPEVGVSPLSLRGFPRLEAVVDLIYNPARTALLMEAEQLGIPGFNGLHMLVAQAWESSGWFTGTLPPVEKIPEIYERLRRDMENIILIGMPGCGKSTVGKALAERVGKGFRDADAELEKTFQLSISDYIHSCGEPAFRALETDILGSLGKQSGLVIATGGGCVTREENYPLLHQNGTVFWLRRSLKKLPTEGRPLSQAGSLETLWEKRKDLYGQFADHIIDNNGSVEDTVQRILEALP